MPEKKKTTYVPPKRIGTCADHLFQFQAERQWLQKMVDAIKAKESILKEHIIATLPKSNASGVAGKLARVTVVSKDVPQVHDWKKFYAYVSRTKSFDLLQRRLNNAAVVERWDNKKTVSGVGTYTVTKVSINKV